jgi:hypothetical protein
MLACLPGLTAHSLHLSLPPRGAPYILSYYAAVLRIVCTSELSGFGSQLPAYALLCFSNTTSQLRVAPRPLCCRTKRPHMCATSHSTSGAASSSWSTSALTALTAARVRGWQAVGQGSGQGMATTTKEVSTLARQQHELCWQWHGHHRSGASVSAVRQQICCACECWPGGAVQRPGHGHYHKGGAYGSSSAAACQGVLCCCMREGVLVAEVLRVMCQGRT